MNKSDTLLELANVYSLLERAVEEDKINPEIIVRLDRLIVSFREKEQEWLERTTENRNVFVMYHGFRNLRLITEKIRCRFIEESKPSYLIVKFMRRLFRRWFELSTDQERRRRDD